MYSLELSLRYSPFPISIQKKEFDDVKRIYDEIKSSMNETLESSNLIELRCDKVQDKLIAVRAKEIISVQIYEKSSVAGGAKKARIFSQHRLIELMRDSLENEIPHIKFKDVSFSIFW